MALREQRDSKKPSSSSLSILWRLHICGRLDSTATSPIKTRAVEIADVHCTENLIPESRTCSSS